MTEHRHRILIVDDDADYAESTTAYLRAHGFDVERVPNGREALKTARLRRPDLVLMDIMMEERTEGFFTVQQLRRDPALREVPVFVVSSLYRDVPEFRVAADPGWTAHDEFLPKPVDLDELLQRITRRLGARSQSAPQNTGGAS